MIQPVFQTTLQIDQGDTLLLINRIALDSDGPSHFVVDAPIDEDTTLIWENSEATAPQVRVVLKSDGTWTAYTIITIGDQP